MQNLQIRNNAATFVSKRELCLNTWEYTFSYDADITWKPGDYTYISIRSGNATDSRGLRRHISIVYLPTLSKQLTIAVRLRESAFKQSLHSLRKGEQIDFTVPYGELVIPRKEIPLVFIVGGIGITAVISVLQYLQNLKSNTFVTILYFNKSIKTTAYVKELETFTKCLPSLQVIYSMTGEDAEWNGEYGRINKDLLQRYIPNPTKSYFYTTGPDGMNQQVEDILYDLKVPDKQVWREDFTGY